MKHLKLYENFKKIIKPKVELEFPTLRQIYNYDCGACALQQVLVYYGIEKREGDLIRQLSTKKTDIIEHGTKLSKIKEVAEYYGLKAEIKRNFTIEGVKKLIDEGIPSILLIQAWRDFSKDPEWKKDYNDGHYVVAVGYNDDNIFFEDPSSFTRAYMSNIELEERWHDRDDDNKTKIEHAAVIIRGDKQYKHSKIIHMD